MDAVFVEIQFPLAAFILLQSFWIKGNAEKGGNSVLILTTIFSTAVCFITVSFFSAKEKTNIFIIIMMINMMMMMMMMMMIDDDDR